MCGVAITLGRPTSGEFFGGSCAKVSSPAPATWPDFRASARAASSINSPRAQLTMRTPFFILAMAAASIIFSVAALSEVCSEMKSERREKFVERDEFDFDFSRGRGRDERIVGEHFHFERASAAGHFGADAAEADEAQRLAAQLGAGERGFFPFARMNRGVGLRHGTRQAEHQRERVFGDANGISAGRVHHQDAATRGGIHVHVIHADAGASDHAKLRGLFEERGRDFRRAANHQTIGVGDFARELPRLLA